MSIIFNYLPRFFHRAKKDSLFISVGSKNLFNVTGSLTGTFCGTPLYTNVTLITGVSKTKSKKTIRSQTYNLIHRLG